MHIDDLTLSEQASPHLSRRIEVDGRAVVVFDGLFAEADIVGLFHFLQHLPYRLDDIDTDDTAYARHWNAAFPVEMAEGMPIFRRCVEFTRQLIAARPLTLVHVQSNLHLYGDMQFPHVDLPGGVTALYYANPTWDERWLGETVFYDASREPVHAVGPKPGRLAIFDGDILHRAGVPSRECYTPRISVAFKFR